MKRFLIIMAICMIALCVSGDGDNNFAIYVSNVSTAAPSTNSLSYGVGGEIEGLFLDFSGATSPTVDVDVVTLTDGSIGIAQTIFSANSLVADAYYPIRIATYDTAGVAIDGGTNANIQIARDTISLILGAANVTNVNVRATVILK